MRGLVGERLSYSLSPQVYNLLAGIRDYQLLEVDETGLKSLLECRDFESLNVTIPYKKTVMAFCDELSERAKAIGSVNTIINQKGHLYGDNTDAAGFVWLLSLYHIDVQNKTAAVLGSGGAALAISYALRQAGAKEVRLVSRTPTQGQLSYSDLISYPASLLINATPVGNHPNLKDSPLDLSVYPQIETVIDIIYNPLRTSLLMQAKDLGKQTAGGLAMLVGQGVEALLDFGVRKLKNQPETVLNTLVKQMTNIVLIGMPDSGKTTIGQALAKCLNREFADVDTLIEKQEKKSIVEIFKESGEEGFRKKERNVIAALAARQSLIIATGGGSILDDGNVRLLKQNGWLVYLQRPLSDLAVSAERPLAQNKTQLEILYQKRAHLYQKAADYVCENLVIEHTLAQIQEAYNDKNNLGS
ncbi:MAG: hypothetical protein LBR25_01195 [Erysipelotrichaceae bacterium]|jgi:shikimate dehydrogenase|nr:hypothetical protein [Erysipelotrichaceae bacterium]